VTSAATEGETLPPSRWWLPIGGIVAIMLVQGVASALLPPDPATLAPVMVPTAVVGLALLLGSPLWVHRDRRYVTAVSDWEPSGWYYWMILPPLTVVLAPLYLLRRHQHVGVP
jgi:uncharacterized membrane protein HdeD (DUF308 family)